MSRLSQVCAVCYHDAEYEDDPIVFCDKCDMPVHKTCYGIARVPEGKW